MKSSYVLKCILTAVSIAILSVSALGQNLIANGSFESEDASVAANNSGILAAVPSPTGWMFTASALGSLSSIESNMDSLRPNDPANGNALVNAEDGVWFISFATQTGKPTSEADYDSLSQVVQTTANTSYTLTYSIYGFGGNGVPGAGDYFNVTWDGQVVSGTQITANAASTLGWVTETATIQGDGNAHTIGFNGASPTFINFDNASLVAQSVPEPSSLAALGLGLAGFFIKRRK